MRQLDAQGAFEHPWMRAAFRDVPRDAFAPDTVWVWHPDDDRYHPVARADDDQRWAALVHHPTEPVVTQVDDGRPVHADGTGRLPTSSLSAADAVLTTLAATDPAPGSRVLHIGTGTGYDSALLCERVGHANLTTVEIDRTLADAARARLLGLGYRPHVVCADGERGHAPGAPYDRVLCTASLSRVPAAWIAQSAPGARIVTPWKSTLQPAGLAVLTVGADRRVAGGRFGMPLTFMDLRGQRRTDNPLPRVYTPQRWAESRSSTSPSRRASSTTSMPASPSASSCPVSTRPVRPHLMPPPPGGCPRTLPGPTCAPGRRTSGATATWPPRPSGRTRGGWRRAARRCSTSA
ncbi:methyltransferase domain-containing protein [Streptomyces sp. Ac-502]|uniref:methyltransferase domain-containing protein n=1 Tax=Streptomyces sp. Ac-502 TaxID=3342801 RepID=UPI003862BC06